MRLAEADACSRTLGAACTDAGAGFAVMQLRVGAQHLNFNGTCHGGVIFTLADATFALASNSHGAMAAAIDAHITYQLAVPPGEVLTARAQEVSRSRRLAVYRVDVTRVDGQPVSCFTGTVYVTSGVHAGAASAQ